MYAIPDIFFFEKRINPNASVQSFAKVGMKVDYKGLLTTA